MIKATIVWGKRGENRRDCKFLYPLKEGDRFVIGDEANRQICRVDIVLHGPVEDTSEDEPTILYGITIVSDKKRWRSWPFWADLIDAVLKK